MSTILTAPDDPPEPPAPEPEPRRPWAVRLVPLAVLVGLAAVVLAMGWHRELSLETLVRHRTAIDIFVAGHTVPALAAFVALYVVVVALSIPGAIYLTIAGGILFGVVVGGLASIVGATIGATLVFLVAKTAFGERC